MQLSSRKGKQQTYEPQHFLQICFLIRNTTYPNSCWLVSISKANDNLTENHLDLSSVTLSCHVYFWVSKMCRLFLLISMLSASTIKYFCVHLNLLKLAESICNNQVIHYTTVLSYCYFFSIQSHYDGCSIS